jgi:hypothetical protein
MRKMICIIEVKIIVSEKLEEYVRSPDNTSNLSK